MAIDPALERELRGRIELLDRDLQAAQQARLAAEGQRF
jgi:hypothetical protein